MKTRKYIINNTEDVYNSPLMISQDLFFVYTLACDTACRRSFIHITTTSCHRLVQNVHSFNRLLNFAK